MNPDQHYVFKPGKATDLLCDGQLVTVSCADGETGRVYEGALPFHVERTELEALARPRTRIQLNVADPSEALRLSFLPHDGVGLAREEFIIARHIQVHPLALVRYAELEDRALQARIDALTRGYPSKVDFFVGAPRPGRDGRARPAPGRGRARALRDVRDSEQRRAAGWTPELFARSRFHAAP